MSAVRRRLFPEQLAEEGCAIAVEYWFRATHGVRSLDFYIEPGILSTGYAYAFPKDPELLVIGLAGVGIDAPRAVLDRMLELPRYRALTRGAPVEAVHGARIPYRHLSRFRDGRLLLVGDAAGLNTPIIFAGLPIALQSGRLAGRLCAAALKLGSDLPLAGYTVEAIRWLSPAFTACHAYYEHLVAQRRPPSFPWLARRFALRPHKLPQVYVMWRALNRLVDGLDLERMAPAPRPLRASPGVTVASRCLGHISSYSLDGVQARWRCHESGAEGSTTRSWADDARASSPRVQLTPARVRLRHRADDRTSYTDHVELRRRRDQRGLGSSGAGGGGVSVVSNLPVPPGAAPSLSPRAPLRTSRSCPGPASTAP